MDRIGIRGFTGAECHCEDHCTKQKIHNITQMMLIVITALSAWMVKNQCSLLLGHDQRNAGTVGLQGRTLIAGPAVEHGQCGQWRRNAAASSHVPELVRVPMDGLVVVQLESAAQRNTQILFYCIKLA